MSTLYTDDTAPFWVWQWIEKQKVPCNGSQGVVLRNVQRDHTFIHKHICIASALQKVQYCICCLHVCKRPQNTRKYVTFSLVCDPFPSWELGQSTGLLINQISHTPRLHGSQKEKSSAFCLVETSCARSPEVATHSALRKKMHLDLLFLNSKQQEGEQRLEKNEIARDAEKDKRRMI